MGTGSRIDLANSKANAFIPGPGKYSTADGTRRNAPHYGFGSQSRPEIGKSGIFKTPAPGQYN